MESSSLSQVLVLSPFSVSTAQSVLELKIFRCQDDLLASKRTEDLGVVDVYLGSKLVLLLLWKCSNSTLKCQEWHHLNLTKAAKLATFR